METNEEEDKQREAAKTTEIIYTYIYICIHIYIYIYLNKIDKRLIILLYNYK